MSDYTPEPHDILDSLVSGRAYLVLERELGITIIKAEKLALAEFDRWLTEHGRQIAEEAWESAFDRMNHYDDPGPNPYRKAADQMLSLISNKIGETDE